MTRKLAAIIAADVVGYSRLMGADEAGTLAALKTHRRELVDPRIAAHHGRIVKTTGDGLLIEFPSVVEAVQCAVEAEAPALASLRLLFAVSRPIPDALNSSAHDPRRSFHGCGSRN
jgi:class 3 adenylate cyclase